MRKHWAGGAARGARAVLWFAVLTSGVPRLEAQIGIPAGQPAPVVTINDLDGTPYDLATVIGKKPVLIEFWATWCPLCESLLPQLRAARARYGDELELLGVNVTVNQSRDRVRRYIEQHQPPFRTLWDDRGVAVRAYDVPGTSFIVIVDGEGRVAYTGIGEDQDIGAALRRVFGR